MFENIVGFLKSQGAHDDFMTTDIHEKNIITYDPATIGNLGYKREDVNKTIEMLNEYSIEVGK